jgi:hypothetical protein
MNQVNFVEKVACKIARLGLAMPAMLLLEAHKPVAFIGGQFLLVAQPTLDLFISSHLTQGMVDVLTHPDQLEQLITCLEQQTSRPPASLERPSIAIELNKEANL